VTIITGRARAISSSEWFNLVRIAAENAATQLKPPRESGLLLVAVLGDRKGMHVSLATSDVIHALYRDPTWPIQIDAATSGTDRFGGTAELAMLFEDTFSGLRPELSIGNMVVDGDRVACELTERLIVGGVAHVDHMAGFDQVESERITERKIYREGSADI